MPREVEHVKRKPLARPIREQLDELAAAEEIFGSERQDLGHSVTCDAGAQHGADIVHGQTAGNRDPELLPPTVEARSARVGKPLELTAWCWPRR